MPLDATGYRPERPERRPRPPSDRVVSVLIYGIAFMLIVVPISLPALVDLVRYLRR